MKQKLSPVVQLGGLFLWAMLFCSPAQGARIPEQVALDRMFQWMERHPVMKSAAGRTVQALEIFPDQNAASPVYVVSLSPQGYVILNGDDRLPLVVAFSESSGVSLEDVPENTLLAALRAHVEQTAQRLAAMETGLIPQAAPSAEPLEEGLTELYGPYLETSWNQCNPYNRLCPYDPAGSEYYGYRAPAGCVPTAYAQVLAYHRWPLCGSGSSTYQDTGGSITGLHSAVFSDPYGWSALQTTYDAFTTDQPGDDEVAKLLYELGVAANANYENNGTSASVTTLGEQLGKFFYFESPTYHASQSELLTALDDDLRAGYPAVVSIPGHAIVADGLLLDGATTSYHINYGWGGQNNGWWSANGVPGGAISSGCTTLRPELMPFPQSQSVQGIEGEPVELCWILPKRRESEATRLLLRELRLQTNSWSSSASTMDQTVSIGWDSRTGGHAGNGWYAGPNGYAVLTLTDQFVPDSAASLAFWMQYRLGTAAFTVSVSTNSGETFTELFRRDNNYSLSWQPYTVALGAYAGERIQLRFELHPGTYYTTGGVWLDDLSLSAAAWHHWEAFAEDPVLASRRFSEERTLWDAASDFSVFEVTSTSSYKDWAIAATGDGGSCFYKEPGGYGNREYHLTSRTPVTPGATTRLLLRWKRNLASDRLRVLLSTNRTTFTEIWNAGGESDWTEQALALTNFAGQAVYVRLEYDVDSYYTDGGVWIDSVSLQDTVYPELEGQPVHYTLLDELEPGTYTLAAALVDHTEQVHRQSPAFVLTVHSAFTYQTQPNGTIALTGYNGTQSQLTIPSAIDGKTVSSIAAGAFEGSNLISVMLPSGLGTLTANAFSGVTTLQRVYCLGNAPTVAGDPFPHSAPTLYYLYGTTGWNSALAGHPTALWNPVLESQHAQFGPVSGGFRILFTGPANHQAIIEASTNLISGPWIPIGTNALPGGTGEFTDPSGGALTNRFYRIRLNPPSL